MRLGVDQGLRGRLVSPLWLGRMLEPMPRPFWSRRITCSLFGYACLRVSCAYLVMGTFGKWYSIIFEVAGTYWLYGNVAYFRLVKLVICVCWPLSIDGTYMFMWLSVYAVVYLRDLFVN